MSNKDDFYIGWQGTMPESRSSFLRKFLIPIFILIPILAIVFVYVQKPFNGYIFEFGKGTEITGTYIADPFPMILAQHRNLPDGLSREVLLVGYGKFGAKGIMQDIQDKAGSLNGKAITMTGTLIYGDGKTLLELTDEEDSLTGISNNEIIEVPASASNPVQVNLTGEIIDPKCYFGVMKPAEGKIHKSCAIRCISGGIPPVFRHETGQVDRPYEYYLMTDTNGVELNKDILPFVAEQVKLTGIASSSMGWNTVRVDLANLVLKNM